MSRIRQSGTAAELTVGRLLRRTGLVYRKNVRALPGSPDFANRRRRWAVFVHGCFWHHHTGCGRATVPRTNRAFWTGKFVQNRTRDAAAIRRLRRAGYRVVLIWECESEAEVLRRVSKLPKAGGPNLCEPIDH
ncbi:MAG: DNA mismatch endonuclease Vsr [Rhodospirillales bacterium]|nr:DNA mismatch endonuclease Vsr [Rhodospirillales bacterium]